MCSATTVSGGARARRRSREVWRLYRYEQPALSPVLCILVLSVQVTANQWTATRGKLGTSKCRGIGTRHDVMHLDVEKLKWLSHTERTPDVKKLAFLVVLDLLLCRALHLL